MTSGVMTQGDHRLISTPVSVADGMKRGDSKTWGVLLVAGAAAVGIVFLINAFVEKPARVRWPSSPVAGEQSKEPRTFDVAPPDAVPAKPRR
jgi:hypothetical protein